MLAARRGIRTCDGPCPAISKRDCITNFRIVLFKSTERQLSNFGSIIRNVGLKGGKA